MTWSYLGDPSTSDKDAVRFLVGDTDTSDQQISDEEIDYILTVHSDLFLAASLAARAIGSKYARQVGSSIDSVRVFAADRFKHYKQLALDLKRQSASSSASGIGSPVITGISDSEIRSVEEDTDRIKSAFKKGMFNNPQFSDQSSQSEWEI